MYLHDELIILGLIFIDVIIVFYVYRYIKNKYKTQIKELQKEIHTLKKNKSMSVKESDFSDTKKVLLLNKSKKWKRLKKS